GETAYSIQSTVGDHIVALYKADDCDGELVEVEACKDFPESFNGIYEAGTYYIRVRPYSNATIFNFTMECWEPMPNDLACNAEPIDCNTGTISGTTVGATDDVECGGATGGP